MKPLIISSSAKGKKIAIALLLVSLIGASAVCFSLYNSEPEPAMPDSQQPQEESKALEPMDPELRSRWLESKAINEDYIGEIIFDSGLIELPFVQAKDVYREDGAMYRFYTEDGALVEDPEGYTGNDVYIWTSWKTGEYDRYGEGGSTFMDYRNALDDDVMVIYGHHFARDYDPSGSRLFTPLDLLLEKENYESNRTLELVLDNEIRRYEVAMVCIADVTDADDIAIIADLAYDKNIISRMEDAAAYDTGVRIEEGDRLLVLVTCIEHMPQLRQFVVCRQTEVKKFG